MTPPGEVVGPTTIVQADTHAQPQPREPRELPEKAGANALASALNKLRTDIDTGAVKLDGTTDAEIIEAGGVLERERALEAAAAKPPGKAPDDGATTADDDTGAAPDPDAAPDASADEQWPQQQPDGKWKGKDGKYVAAPGTEKPADAAAATPDPIVVKIPQGANEPDLEIEVPDQAVADRINELRNDGLRKAEFTRRLEAIESRELDMRTQEAVLERSPESFVVERLKPEARVEIAKAILAAHWDDLMPTLIDYANEQTGAGTRKLALADFKEKAIASKQAMESERSNQRAAQVIIRAVQRLIPEDAPEDTVRRFIRVADAELSEKIRGGTQVTADNVKDHLSPVLRDFRFDEASRASSTAPAPAKRPAAAASTATPPAPGASSTRTTTQRSEEQQRKIATQRATARRVAPAGAGGIPAQPVQIPKGTTLKDAFKFVRENPGMLNRTAS